MKQKFIFSTLLCLSIFANAQTTQTTFGKNRVQFHKQFEDWLYYETPNFTTYWYGAARNVGQASLQLAELDYAEVQSLMEYPIAEKIELVVFADITDLKQSNIGEDEVFQTRAGQTKVIGNKVFVYYDGNHQHLRAQIREGVAGVLLNAMLYGSNLQEIVQNAVLLNLPPWFTEGLTAYCGQTWNEDLDNQLRDLLLSGKYKTFDKLIKAHPRLAGHAFWYYTALHFGKGTVSTLLYLTRINRSVDAGFLYVLGGGYKRTTEALMQYFTKRYQKDASLLNEPESADLFFIKNKKKLPITQIKISPDGKRLAWVSNDIGKWRVWVADFQSGHKKCILKKGVRNAIQATDYNYPLLAWSPDNQRLAVAYEHRDIIRLSLLNLENGLKTKGKKVHFVLPKDYQRLYSIDFLNSVDLVFSAASSGYTDLFLYHTMTAASERLTQDFWDDLDAKSVWLGGKPGILFASNRLSDTLVPARLDTILPISNFDIFYYDLQSRSSELLRITQTPYADERNPQQADSTFFTFLSNENGVNNRAAGFLEDYVAYYQKTFYLKDGSDVKALNTQKQGEWDLKKALLFLEPADTVLKNLDKTQIDSVREKPILKKRAFVYNQTNFDRSVSEHHISNRTGNMVQLIWRNGMPGVYREKISPRSALVAPLTRFRELTLQDAGVSATTPILPDSLLFSKSAEAEPFTEKKDTIRPIEAGWYFQVPPHLEKIATPLPKPTEPTVNQADTNTETPKTNINIEQKEGLVLRFNQSRIIPYRLKFRTDFISTNVDNNLLFEGLESTASAPDGFRTPPPGILLKANFKDLLEDYVFEMGVRLPTTFNGAEYYAWFDNKKTRLDRRIALYRKTVLNTLDNEVSPISQYPIQMRTNTVLGQYEVKYPLDIFTAIKATGTLRQDRPLILSTDPSTLARPDTLTSQRAALRISGIYDNTVDVDLNLKTGTRAKVFVEVMKKFEFQTDPKWDLNFNKGIMTVVGIDARHYQPLDRRSILALRLAGATTFGSERILYYLGGVDNWVIPQFNNNIPVPKSDDFAFQTLAANLRGFKQNIRNGNSYALFNSELRVPIFKYFSRKPVMGSFWRNFQLVGFFDAGTAWQGKNPYSGDNPLNIVTLQNPPTVTIKVNYFRDPLVMGYGAGVRAMLFGMFLRVDYGWGIETRVVQKPVLHVALGTDF